jgi:hypothetical protein
MHGDILQRNREAIYAKYVIFLPVEQFKTQMSLRFAVTELDNFNFCGVLPYAVKYGGRHFYLNRRTYKAQNVYLQRKL